MRSLKVKAGALQLTLFIAVVIALLLASFLILINTHKLFNIQSDFAHETINNANTGVFYALERDLPLETETTININDSREYSTLNVQRHFWGVFENIRSKATIKTYQFEKKALAGGVQKSEDRPALYLRDNNKALVLVGNTKIEGVAYLPKQGAKPGNISGQSYYGSQLIYGQVRQSSSQKKLSGNLITHLRKLYRQADDSQDIQYLNIDRLKKHEVSFSEKMQTVYSNDTIVLQDVELIGHIKVRSRSKIIVDPTAKLKDVVLIAPEIEIRGHSRVTCQAIAFKKITVGKNSQLEYPSALVLFQDSEPDSKPFKPGEQQHIKIDSEAKISGVVLYEGKIAANNYRPQVIIEENAHITGEVYCNQNLELKGTVFGTVLTNNFVANQSGSIYQNHIYNGTIISNELPEEFAGLLLHNQKKGVGKWLY